MCIKSVRLCKYLFALLNKLVFKCLLLVLKIFYYLITPPFNYTLLFNYLTIFLPFMRLFLEYTRLNRGQ